MTTISRRGFLGSAAALGGAAALGAALWPSRRKRNVILIISDSMRADVPRCYGRDWVDTPHIDAFARSAVRCTNAYTCSFPTVPARHDILTSTYTFTYKVWSALDPDTLTLQNVLHAADVHTALIADTHSPFRPAFNYQRDFDFFQKIRGQEDDDYVIAPIDVHFPCDPEKLRDADHYVRQYLKNVSGRTSEEDYFCAKTMRSAAHWLEKSHARQPFFLYVDTFDPHEPWDPPHSYVERYDPNYAGQEVICPRYDRWKDFLTPQELNHCQALYRGEATMVDHWFGHLMDTVQRLGLLENTLILFISDHGVCLGEHGFIGKGVIRHPLLQNFPLYPELCRVPFMAYYPGCKSGSTVSGLVQPVNVAATILDWLGIKIPEAFRGPSAWPLLQGHEERIHDIVIAAPTLSFPGNRVPRPTDRASITDGRWLLVYACAGWGDELGKKPHSPEYKAKRVEPFTGGRLDPLLFDLSADPGCLKNVYLDNKPVAADLHRRFFEFLKASPMRRDHLEYFEKLENA
jgi:arylsulfatase A-like enzyme